MRDSSNRDAKSLRAKRLEAEQGYLVLLFCCLSNLLSSNSLLLFLLFVSRISLTLICPYRSSYLTSRILVSALQALRIPHLVYAHLPFKLFVSRIPFTRICPSSSSYLASRLRASALLLFLIARYKKGRS